MINISAVKLGKRRARVDMRVPLLRQYVADDIKVPDVCDWTKGKATIPMLGNSEYSNCTSCAMAHLIGTAAFASGRGYWTASRAIALNEYHLSTGWTQNDPSTDNGGVEADVLAYWHKHSYAGFTVDSYGRVGLGDLDMLRKCIFVLSGCYIGASLPKSIEGQDVWRVPKGGLVGDGVPNSLGGHAMKTSRYDRNKGLFYLATWDREDQPADEEWVHAYVDEMWGVALTAFLDKSTHVSPNGFDRAALRDRCRHMG